MLLSPSASTCWNTRQNASLVPSSHLTRGTHPSKPSIHAKFSSEQMAFFSSPMEIPPLLFASMRSNTFLKNAWSSALKEARPVWAAARAPSLCWRSAKATSSGHEMLALPSASTLRKALRKASRVPSSCLTRNVLGKPNACAKSSSASRALMASIMEMVPPPLTSTRWKTACSTVRSCSASEALSLPRPALAGRTSAWGCTTGGRLSGSARPALVGVGLLLTRWHSAKAIISCHVMQVLSSASRRWKALRKASRVPSSCLTRNVPGNPSTRAKRSSVSRALIASITEMAPLWFTSARWKTADNAAKSSPVRDACGELAEVEADAKDHGERTAASPVGCRKSGLCPLRLGGVVGTSVSASSLWTEDTKTLTSRVPSRMIFKSTSALIPLTSRSSLSSSFLTADTTRSMAPSTTVLELKSNTVMDSWSSLRISSQMVVAWPLRCRAFVTCSSNTLAFVRCKSQ
mmetsp:Transcript_40770/g.113331  ORF Transcript_40770/g.113331 Transcript_40770/m.113331 type:complete len:461 (-) Transcript_40770:1017-2399(-)